MTDESPSLAAFLEQVAAELADVETSLDGDATTYRTSGIDFAVVRPGEASFRLRADVAKGALGTPETAPAPQGPAWVRFTPSTLETFDLDRAEAWLVIAHRFASQPSTAKASRPH